MGPTAPAAPVSIRRAFHPPDGSSTTPAYSAHVRSTSPFATVSRTRPTRAGRTRLRTSSATRSRRIAGLHMSSRSHPKALSGTSSTSSCVRPPFSGLGWVWCCSNSHPPGRGMMMGSQVCCMPCRTTTVTPSSSATNHGTTKQCTARSLRATPPRCCLKPPARPHVLSLPGLLPTFACAPPSTHRALARHGACCCRRRAQCEIIYVFTKHEGVAADNPYGGVGLAQWLVLKTKLEHQPPRQPREMSGAG